ncbi:uncharacterized protein TrAFT101_008760 [Trichoderma asperellum]|uniref:uncharacterized protein n=1 Tax=Trichoderma asperellum TaxID=101201 RepID=UPI00331A5D94|nr:hypothetical protein TrAFT101_008760 [Trichoderma asperellum]
MMKAFVTHLLVLIGLIRSSLAQGDESPTVKLPGSLVHGIFANGVDSFYGMPYAESPAGLNRLKRPVKRTKPLGDFDATTIPPACPQGHFEAVDSDELWRKRSLNADSTLAKWHAAHPVHTSEDCLTITVQRPAGTKAGDSLPVLFMLTGFSFVIGTPYRYNATDFIKFSAEIELPFILVTANYRTGPWGFLPGQQVMKNGSTNLGLRDQRMSMEWASDNIAAFGGDPDEITLWGHASGGVSVLDHLVINGGNATYNDRKLFRGAIMSSGSLMPAEHIDSEKCNKLYTKIVKAIGCERKRDTLQCLREIPYSDFERATSSIPGALSAEALRLVYVPRPDNDLIRYSPEVLLNDNMFAAVPMILGNQEDEGTIFTQKQTSVNDTKPLSQYLRTQYFGNATKRNMEDFLKKYHKKPFEGSPYRTGDDFESWAGKKRLSSVIGDVFFTLSRRVAMEFIALSQPLLPIWGYHAAYDYRNGDSSAYGTAHGSFEAMIFGTDEYIASYTTRTARWYLINFVYHLDPNKKHTELVAWPKWTPDEPRMLIFNKTNNANMLDVHRKGNSKFMKKNIEKFRI